MWGSAMGTLRGRASRPVLRYACLGGYGVVWHHISGGLRMTPGRVPENVTLCGRVIHDGDRISESRDAPPWPPCAACARVMEKET